ncbi:MAG: LysR family transcriptional regulator [Gammaproteobacteria bacterium]|nr:LysR family transcriptional regulator [Gammaproteobacteria bacterium]
MRFKHYEGLRTFCVVARHGRISSAAEELNLTKGAVSHQLKALEAELGFDVFDRQPRGVRTTPKGQHLLHTARSAFDMLDRQIGNLREEQRRAVTLGLSTYLAPRWLSSHLTSFIQAYPGLRLHIQPMVDLFDLKREGIDVAIRWGKGDWNDMLIVPLFGCPAFPVAAPRICDRLRDESIEDLIADLTLLDDTDESTVWPEWLNAAELPAFARRASLTIRLAQ